MPKITEGQYALGGLTVFVVWVFFVLPFLYQTPVAEKYDSKQSEAAARNAAHRDGHAGPPIAATSDACANPNADAHAANEAENNGGEFWAAKLTDWLLAVFTLLLVFFTARLYYATAGLRDSTDKLWVASERQMALIDRNAAEQADDMKASIEQARRGADAAVAGAAAAKESADATRDIVAQTDQNFKIQLRAYVAFQQFEYFKFTNNEATAVVGYGFRALWKNVGQTPGKITRTGIGWVWKDVADLSQVVFELPKQDDTNINLGATIAHPTSRAMFTISDIMTILDDKKRLFFFSHIDYHDIFDNARIYREHVAVEVKSFGDILIVEPTPTPFSFIGITNYRADEK
jgi:hypothetical protein